MPAGGSLQPASIDSVKNRLHFVRQEGKTVFKKAVKEMANITFQVANRNNLSNENIDLFIPHQANKRIIDAAANKLGLKDSQVMINIDKYANTTSATLPICISEAIEKNILKGTIKELEFLGSNIRGHIAVDFKSEKANIICNFASEYILNNNIQNNSSVNISLQPHALKVVKA